MKLLDNKGHGRVIDTMRDAIVTDGTMSMLTGELSIFAWNELKKEMARQSKARLLLSSNTDTDNLSNNKEDPTAFATSLLGPLEERRARNSLLAPAIAQDFTEWLKKKADVRLSAMAAPFSIYCFSDDTSQTTSAIQGSTPFTLGGLGVVPSLKSELSHFYEQNDGLLALSEVFEQFWSGAEKNDVKQALRHALATLYTHRSPRLLYFLMLHHLFHDAKDTFDEERIVKSRTGIYDTVIWNKLYQFQRDGVLGAVDKIESHNGCIIADSVGLGKTFEALAIIKYYELRNHRVLVLAPKKLRENWTVYTINDKRNILAADRFNYDVLNHTDLTRQSGKSGEIDLSTLNFGNYDLVVIDESHNFRNNPPNTRGLTRYSRLMEDIVKAGVKTKVLLLSATPVNNRMNDIKNQVAFITEGNDKAFKDDGIANIDNTLRLAQKEFNQWLRQPPDIRTAKSLLDTLGMDYFNLLDLISIARSRKHIVKYYDTAEIGTFPVRRRPINIKEGIDVAGGFPPLEEVNKNIRRLRLSAYAPLNYVMPDKCQAYEELYDRPLQSGSKFRQTDRENSLIQLMRVNLLKRMESSISSFTDTVDKLLQKVRELIARIDAYDGKDDASISIEEIDDIDDDAFLPYLVGTKTKVLLKDVDRIRWRQDLYEDEALLVTLLDQAAEVDARRDQKLEKLRELLAQKVAEPINPNNRKAIIFTAFADTARYLYDNIAPWAQSTLGVHSAVVTGTGASKTTIKGLRTDLSTILTHFSPISKQRDKVDDTAVTEIDFLIATDCISEGQNLQDCDYLINYDIHWNPVRIIQRFGRIDRLGSRNKEIQLVNFWPDMDLDAYINLEARVSGRMVLCDISATGEENIIEATEQEQMNDLEYRRRQLEQLQSEVIDLEDLSNGISITDLTLNDFKVDLASYRKEKETSLDAYPLGTFAVTRATLPKTDRDLDPGVIFCLRNDAKKPVKDKNYSLEPHYLIYVSADGTINENYTHTRRILDLMKQLSLETPTPDEDAYRALQEITNRGHHMEVIQELLAKAVSAITGKAEELGVESLFQQGGTALSRDSFQGMDDFEVVAYLVILDGEDA
jgi:superfamily II DNA or RNA helicase